MANIDSTSNRGYKIRVEINQTKENTVRAKLILINTTNRFQLYTCTGYMEVEGQRFNYSGQPNLKKFNSKVVLLDKTVTVKDGVFNVDAELNIPTGAVYLPSRGRFRINEGVYRLPKSGSSDNTQDSGKRGGSLSWELPADSAGEKGSLNEKIAWKQVFWAGSFSQGGYIKVQISDEDDEFLYGVETIKRKKGTESEYNFLVSDGEGGYIKKKSWKFSPTDKKKENPFHKDSGLVTLERKGEEVKVLYNGKYTTFKVKEIKGKKSKKLHLAMGHEGGLGLITRMYVDGLYFQKDNVEGFEDVPNRFPLNSEVVIDAEQDRLFLDGSPKNDEVVTGSDWITIPPGDSQLEIGFSEWISQKPKVTIEFEERWL